MSGKIHNMVEELITKRSKGNDSVAELLRARLILKGINPADFTPSAPDDESVILKLKAIAADWGIELAV